MTVVRIGEGALRGRHSDGVHAFRDIPYAHADRFGLPTVAVLTGERDAGEYGPTAPQGSTRIPGVDLEAIVGPGWVRGEDYLTANVWTPDPGASGLPVMVFVHGGSFTGGSGTTLGYDGGAFARDGVVLVTVNYRLGVIGFGSLPGVPENRGLHDQLAALRWVRANIAAFGGDPDNVTVFGESAGALSVCDLLAVMPPGLVRRAVSESGGGSHLLTPAQAAVTTRAVAEVLGVPATAAAFAEVSEADLVDALAKVTAQQPNLAVDGLADPLMGLSPIGPVLDGDLFRHQPVDSVREGAAAGVDLLIGHNAEEMNLYLVGLGAAMPEVTPELLGFAVSRLHPEPDAVIGAYRAAGRGRTPGELLSAIGTDYMFGVPTARMADAHAPHAAGTWRYEFAWRSPAFGGRLGACHGLELPFVFDAVDRVDFGVLGVTATDETRALAAEVHRAWVRFARDGDPGWPRYTPENAVVRRIDTEWTLIDGADAGETAVWEGIR
ncbi:carboxylesterase family protein [Umezawaea sp. Da 62-37]|uniref:carboxylesterase/lipase family protein n=1 Tax=Umezawaea sp. Da 62-37 TaxID=3075927 RepID=UPI0028F6DC51|nr:carboxylesterase family protein [Umezawaea sp. Da 62-37]WNV88317.1 carboxylesterase family protein [Umezawaea sp. Da 62-37]